MLQLLQSDGRIAGIIRKKKHNLFMKQTINKILSPFLVFFPNFAAL